jgi:uncharacterized membrane protein YeaQ/YmgE (transglycosylase-associated protein family)
MLASMTIIHLASTSITITTADIVYVIIAAIVGLVAETIVGWRLPFGIIGAIIAALIGIWLFTNIIQLNMPDYTLSVAGASVPLLRALIGAVIVVAIWHLLTFSSWRRRERYYRGYRRDRY